MASVNYQQIAKDFPNPEDGLRELESQLRRPPKFGETAQLTQAYINIASAKSTLGGRTSGNIKDPFAIAEARVGKSKIQDVGANDAIDPFKFLKEDMAGKSAMMQTEILNQLQRQADLHTYIGEKVGLTGEMLSRYKNIIADSSVYALKYGYSMDHVSSMIGDIAETTGKASIMSEQVLNRSYETSRAFVGRLSDLGKAFVEFEKIGLGAKDTMDAIDRSGRSSLSLGLNAKKTTEMLKSDISKLNEYGFASGVDGLNRMVQRSLEFRMNMGEVFKIADKVMDPDKAIELTANMQMLGGAIGDLNDPLKLMYMATNNVEGLQEAMMGAVENLATYNEEQQRFEVTGINLRRVREMANAMGVDYKELTKGAIASQERMMVMNDLMGKGFDIPEKDKEFIANMAQMKDGKMTITIPDDVAKKMGTSTQIAVDELDKNQIDQLTKFREDLKVLSTEEIARGQYDKVTQIQKDLQTLIQGSVRGLARRTIGEGGSFDIAGKDDKGEKTGFARFDKTLDILTKKQAAGSEGLLGSTLENLLIKPLETISSAVVSSLDTVLNNVFSGIENKAKERVSDDKARERLKEDEEERKKRMNESKPIAINLKHDFNLIPRFDVPFNLDYKGSKEEYV